LTSHSAGRFKSPYKKTAPSAVESPIYTADQHTDRACSVKKKTIKLDTSAQSAERLQDKYLSRSRLKFPDMPLRDYFADNAFTRGSDGRGTRDRRTLPGRQSLLYVRWVL
ncbi:MAG: hypothetical protein KAJ46_05150, partial [Sedimentisphaerales bacterium]|nr:hypothetical protein [Sedimentisphaerales bacterium]